MWSRLGRADSRLVVALLAPQGELREAIAEVPGERPVLAAALAVDTPAATVAAVDLAAVADGRSEREWQSVTEHVWVLSVLAGVAGRPELVTWLDALASALDA